MSKIEHKEFKVDIQLKSIELLKATIEIPSEPVSEDLLSQFNFNVTLETKADREKKAFFVIVSTQISSQDQVHKFGNLAVACIYSFSNFNEVVQFSADGKTHSIHQDLLHLLNSISLSTARGYMAATFKGTILHNAFLPIIDPKTFTPASAGQ